MLAVVIKTSLKIIACSFLVDDMLPSKYCVEISTEKYSKYLKGVEVDKSRGGQR